MLTFRQPTTLLFLTLALALNACGGGSNTSNGGGGQMGGGPPEWPQPGGGTSTERPPSLRTGRVIFRSATGEACCVAVDPSTLTGTTSSGFSLLVLDDLPLGPATVLVAGFATDFAPAVADITMTCLTFPPETGEPCDPTQIATAVFESDPLSVVIQRGAQVEIADSMIHSLPFLVNFTPGPDALVSNLVQFVLTMADAASGVNPDSIEVTVTVNVEAPDEVPPFRLLTKRVPLTLTACNDGGQPTCSPDGTLGVTGFQATGTSPKLPPGSADVHVVGQNLDTPPRSMSLEYVIDVAPDPTPIPTPIPTSIPTPIIAATSLDTERSADEAASPQTGNGVTQVQDEQPWATEGTGADSPNAPGGGSVGQSRWYPTPTPTPVVDAAQAGVS